MPTPEEQRALDWQASERRRKEFGRSLQARLKGSGQALKTILKNWDPIIRR